MSFLDFQMNFVEDRLAVISSALDNHLKSENENLSNISFNYRTLTEMHILKGLYLWRQKIDPRNEFHKAIDFYDLSVSYFQKDKDSDITKSNYPEVISIISFLIDRPIKFLPRQKDVVRKFVSFKEHLARFLLDEIKTVNTQEIQKLLIDNKLKLITQTYKNYFELLSHENNAETRSKLISSCETNFLKRKSNNTYKTLPAFYGGGEQNNIIYDWELSAVLKKIGYKGDSIHIWQPEALSHPEPKQQNRNSFFGAFFKRR